MQERRLIKPVTLDEVWTAIDMLDRDVVSLQKDAAKLAGRIIPYPNERPKEIELLGIPQPPKPRTLDQVVAYLCEMDKRIKYAGYDLNAARGNIDQISNDAYSRADLKQYIDRKRP